MRHSQKVLLTVHLLSYSKLIKAFDIIFSCITKRALLNGHQGYKFTITWFLGPAHQRKHFVTGLHVSSRHTSHTLWHQAAMQKDLMYVQCKAVWESFDLNYKTEPTRNGVEVAVERREFHPPSLRPVWNQASPVISKNKCFMPTVNQAWWYYLNLTTW